MITIEECSKILDVNINTLKRFEEIDTFNNNNLIKGFICRQSDHRYGCLLITNVNDEDCKQIIWATPKLDYPFDRAGNYHFPDCSIIKFYEKLDGTNILAYHYFYKNFEFVTFKTRLTPILKDQKFGMFKSMWLEYINENNWVDQVIKDNYSFNLSFEMFGSRNPITIMYDILLDVNLLFGVRRNDHAIKPPSELKLSLQTKTPNTFLLTGFTKSLIENYNSMRDLMTSKNKDSLTIEGMVQYCHVGKPSWIMLKCKPEEIEKIHWTASGFIPEKSLFNTALNVFESIDDPSIDDFIELLKEEYPQELITKSYHKIEKVWFKAIERIEFTKTVNEIWILAKQNGLDITKDKRETMRFVSKHFSKNIMGKVGTVILKLAGLK
jgi:hypothetical protein